jgi:hypothetical protein
MLYISDLLKISQSLTFFYFSIHICNHFNHTKLRVKVAPTLRLFFVSFHKVGLVFSWLGAVASGAAGAEVV